MADKNFCSSDGTSGWPSSIQLHHIEKPVCPSAKVCNNHCHLFRIIDKQKLGEIQFTNHYELFVNLGAGKSCTIKPTVLNRNDLQLMVALDSKNTKGGVKGLSIVKVVAKSGESFDVAVGDMNLTIIPRLAVQ